MSSLTRRLRRNSLWKLAGDGSRVLLALFLLLVARHYGPRTFGVFSLVYASAIFLSIVIDLGLNLLVTRQIAADKAAAGDSLRAFFACKLLILPVWALAAFAVQELGFCRGASLSLILLVVVAHAGRNLLEFFGAVFTGFERIENEAVLKLAAHVSMLGLGAWAMARGLSIEWIGGAMLAAYFFGAAIGAIWCHKRWGLSPLAFHAEGLSIVYSEALPLILMAAGLATLTKWNTMLMGFFDIPAAEIGWFGAAEKVVSGLGILPALVAMGAYPILSDLHRNEPRHFSSARNRLLQLFVLAGTACAAGVLFAGPFLVRALFGASYLSAKVPLALLGLGLIFTFPNYILLNMMVAANRSWDGARTALIACVANVALTSALIPAYGMPGAAVSSSLSEGVCFFCGLYFVYRTRVQGRDESRAATESLA